jgi:hypothetical protein
VNYGVDTRLDLPATYKAFLHKFAWHFVMVRDRGFEPLTPTVSTYPEPSWAVSSLVGDSI